MYLILCRIQDPLILRCFHFKGHGIHWHIVKGHAVAGLSHTFFYVRFANLIDMVVIDLHFKPHHLPSTEV